MSRNPTISLDQVVAIKKVAGWILMIMGLVSFYETGASWIKAGEIWGQTQAIADILFFLAGVQLINKSSIKIVRYLCLGSIAFTLITLSHFLWIIIDPNVSVSLKMYSVNVHRVTIVAAVMVVVFSLLKSVVLAGVWWFLGQPFNQQN